jgi:hypothetical protein
LDFRVPRWSIRYFAAGAGVAEVEGVVETAFLCFFTAFLLVVAVLVAGAGEAGAAGVCASEMPAVASARENPMMVEVIFFMMFCPVLFLFDFFEALSLRPLYTLTRATINRP